MLGTSLAASIPPGTEDRERCEGHRHAGHDRAADEVAPVARTDHRARGRRATSASAGIAGGRGRGAARGPGGQAGPGRRVGALFRTPRARLGGPRVSSGEDACADRDRLVASAPRRTLPLRVHRRIPLEEGHGHLGPHAGLHFGTRTHDPPPSVLLGDELPLLPQEAEGKGPRPTRHPRTPPHRFGRCGFCDVCVRRMGG